jgi:inhibitor of KinA
MPFQHTIFPLGDSALTVDFGNRIDEALNKRVLYLFGKMQKLSPHIIDVVAAYSSLTFYYDVSALRSTGQPAFEAVKKMIEPFLREGQDTTDSFQSRSIRIPVCYAKAFALDIDELAEQKSLSVTDVVHLHTAKTYRVYMIGFLPGFAYMGSVDERIATPRKTQPRTAVPAGSIGIAGEQTGIYPLASPGGWNIVGRTPVKLFAAEKQEPVLLQTGDEITFYSITEDEFENYQTGTS